MPVPEFHVGERAFVLNPHLQIFKPLYDYLASPLKGRPGAYFNCPVDTGVSVPPVKPHLVSSRLDALFENGLEIHWSDYPDFLESCQEAGLIEVGYLDASLRHDTGVVQLGRASSSLAPCEVCGRPDGRSASGS